MHQALYRKWRPQTIDEVCGQEHITSILKYETEHHKFSHAYLFCGSRGTGKTTCAKILAKAVNCESPRNGSPCNACPSCLAIDSGAATDVLEMDAASNNGVDNIRDIRDEVVYSPSSLKYRVYIVDEVHMLSGSAFNALLKTLEEPPAHALFILATTELHKLPATIISRCQRFDFRRIATQVLSDRLAYISDQEGIEYETEALRLLSKLAQGGMRDAISLLELCAGTRKPITPALVDETIGSGSRENMEQVIRAVAASDFDGIFNVIENVVRSSRDLAVFWQELLEFYRDMLVMKTSSNAERYLDLTEHESGRLKGIADLFSKETILYHCRLLDETFYDLQRAGSAKRILAEMTLIKMCDTSLDSSADALLSRISQLENAMAMGATLRAPSVSESSGGIVPKEKAEAPKDKHSVPRTEATPPRSSASVEAPTMKLLRGWKEIVEKATVGDGSTRGLLMQSKAFISSDDKIYVKFPHAFVKEMVEKSKIHSALCGAISMETKRPIEEEQLIFGLLEEHEKLSDLDELSID